MKKRFKEKIFFELKKIREVEKKIVQKYEEQKNEMPRTLVYWSRRSIAVGICQNLNNSDQIVTAHRSHAHYLAKEEI